MNVKNLKLDSLTERLRDFDVTKIEVEAKNLNLHINLKGKMNIYEAEEIIQQRFPEYEVKIVFFVEEEKIKKFKKVVGISSGKGGVGKSMTALNLALALRDLGYKVGILDADMYSPSIPGLLGVNEKPITKDGSLIEPVHTHGIELLSMGLFLKDGECQIWQDSLIASAFSQFLLQSNWTCDYLIIDFAGGMNAAYQACLKTCPNIELIMITQPNKMVYRDVIRMFALVKAMNLKVLGFIENMAEEYYPEERLKEFEIDIKYINRIGKIPFIESYQSLIESSYKNHELDLSIFKDLASKIISHTEN